MNRSVARRLLRGDKQKQLETINSVRQRGLKDPGTVLALIEFTDRVLQENGPDTRVFLIVETLADTPDQPIAQMALLRWLELALERQLLTTARQTDPGAQPEPGIRGSQVNTAVPLSAPHAITAPEREWQLLSHTVLISLRGYGDEQVQQRANALLANDDVRLVILAIDILGSNRYEPALPALIEALNSPVFRSDYAFRYSLLQALAQYPQAQASGALADQAEKLSGQLKHLVEQQMVTRSQSAAMPRALVIENRPLRAPDDDSATDSPEAQRYLTRQAPEYPLDVRQREYRTPRFMGVPIYADRITFVIDFSGTMREPVGRAGTRLDVAKRELQQAIGQLPENKWFRVIGFDDRVVPLSPTLVPATVENKARVQRDLAYLQNGHGTNLFGGLQEALLDPERPEVVILLSDGLPTRGEFLADNEILRAIAYTNLFRRITIETIAVGRDSALMKQLALQNGGGTRRVR